MGISTEQPRTVEKVSTAITIAAMELCSASERPHLPRPGDDRPASQSDCARQRRGQIRIVKAGGASPLNYSWQRNGSPIAGATQSTYSINNSQLTDSGARYACVISNAYGSVTTTEAALTIFNGSGSIFDFDGPGGGYPSGGVVQASDGNFYGTTQYGGTYGNGIVFSLTTNGLLSTLVSFDAKNGAQPGAALVSGNRRQFLRNDSSRRDLPEWNNIQNESQRQLTTLVSFDGANGAEPDGALVEGRDGNFYGTTEVGGTNGYGTVFSMTTDGTLTVLHSFNDSDGAYPRSAMIAGSRRQFLRHDPGRRNQRIRHHIQHNHQRHIQHIRILRQHQRRLSARRIGANCRRQFLRHDNRRGNIRPGDSIQDGGQRHTDQPYVI